MSHNLRFSRHGGLDCLTTDQLAQRPTVVMLHGYGADFQDLAGLCQVLDHEAQFNWVFPNGPHTVPISPQMTGRAWFPIDMMELERQLMTGNTRSFAGHLPQGIEPASEQIQRLIDELGIDPAKLVLGGFSQGAMVTCHTALKMPSNPLALLQLSATLVAESQWRPRMEQHAQLKVFQSHGHGDPILPFAAAEELNGMLCQAKADVTFVPFQGAHEIPAQVLDQLRLFLKNIQPRAAVF
jgi:phospholipase/carboxylesterase